MPDRDPLQVTVAGIEPLPGEGMEVRLLVKLRVQNPNDTPVEFNGASLNLDVMGRRFASGVSDQAGTVPRFGEAIVAVPVTVSVLRMARQVHGHARRQAGRAGQLLDERQAERRRHVRHPALLGTRASSPCARSAPACRRHHLNPAGMPRQRAQAAAAGARGRGRRRGAGALLWARGGRSTTVTSIGIGPRRACWRPCSRRCPTTTTRCPAAAAPPLED